MRELRKDFQIHVLAPHQKGLPLYEKIDDMKVYRFRYHLPQFETLAYRGDMHEQVFRGFFSKFVFLFFLLSFWFNAYKIMKRERIKILHCHWWIPAGILGYLLSLITRISFVVTTHGSDVFILRKFRWALPLARVIFRRAFAVTAISSYLKDLINTQLGVEKEKIWRFPMPFDDKKFYPLEEKQIERGSILSIGRMIERKGYKYLIEACSILKKKKVDFKLTIIGGGPDEEKLKQMIKDLNLEENIEILHNIPQKDLVYFYNKSEVFVLPSITDWKMEAEGLGMVLMEAMSCKVPVIGTQSGGIVDVVLHEKTGLLVPEKDPQALAQALKRLFEDDLLKRKVSERGYAYVHENYTPGAISQQLKTIYQSI
jgi:glycosyltransferase involved in cell wall biosynthesis